MVRPKKPRFFEDVLLTDNLYPDSSLRPGVWRYRRPDRSDKIFRASSVEEANNIAEANNAKRKNYTKTNKQDATRPLLPYINYYIVEREKLSPGLKQKASWRNRKYQLQRFADVITTGLPHITREPLLHWWNTLTHHQQKARHAEFRKLFNYLMGRNLLPKLVYNPFTLSDDRPRFYTSEQPQRKSERLERESFWHIYEAAGTLGYPGLQIAMGISLTTFMRQGDICSLQLSSHLEDRLLKKVIGKSLNQKGDANAARLSWDTSSYDLLRQLIHRARILSLQNQGCPFVISHWPKQKRFGQKEHIAQVSPRRLIGMFDEARKLAGFTRPNPPTFHSIRALANALALEANYSREQIQTANAHSSVEVQKVYQDGHELPYSQVDIQFSEQVVGGNFK